MSNKNDDAVVWEYDIDKGHSFRVFDRGNGGEEIPASRCSPKLGLVEYCVATFWSTPGSGGSSSSSSSASSVKRRKGDFLVIGVDDGKLPGPDPDIPF